MDAKEAIKIVKGIKRNGWWIFNKGVKTEFCEVAISALEKVETLEAENARLREKETPKEHGPVSWNIDRWSIHCPSCDAEIDDDSDFCKCCGQAIKNVKE